MKRSFAEKTLPVLLFLFVTTLPLSAFKFEPITMDFDPQGPGATRSFRLENTGEQPVAVKITMHTRTMRSDGTDVLGDASGDFVVYPSRVLLAPGKSQTVRVRWLGTPTPDRELTYRIEAEQIPVESGAEAPRGSGIAIMFRYLGSIYVVPPEVEPDVSVVSVESLDDPSADRKLRVVLRNGGTAHALLIEPVLAIRAQDGTLIELDSERLQGLDGENILPGVEREFLLEWPSELPGGTLSGTLSFTPMR